MLQMQGILPDKRNELSEDKESTYLRRLPLGELIMTTRISRWRSRFGTAIGLKLENPQEIPEKEQARRFRKARRQIWSIVRDIMDEKRSRDYMKSDIATAMVETLLDPKVKDIMDPELDWVAEIRRKGYQIKILPKEGRTIDAEAWED